MEEIFAINDTVGFTGTQKGQTGKQKASLYSLLIDLWREGFRKARHGDCIGSDEEFHNMAKSIGFYMIGHIPVNPSKRAFCKFDLEMPAKDYLPRNHDIVDGSIRMIATPYETIEQLRSGTWATIRYTKKQGKQLYLILP